MAIKGTDLFSGLFSMRKIDPSPLIEGGWGPYEGWRWLERIITGPTI